MGKSKVPRFLVHPVVAVTNGLSLHCRY